MKLLFIYGRPAVGKLTVANEMFLETYDLSSPIPYADTFVIDNTNLEPAAAAKIVDHFGFKRCK